jgi:molybdopterin-guanine dinucleotide biosynthesis protein A/formate dehydrogenase assembly factor FdhD
MGADKALYLMNNSGQGHLSALAGELAGRFGEVILVADDRRKLAAYADLRSFTQVEDLRPGAGPVGAILTALVYMPERPVFVLACDMPVIDWDIAGRLKDLMDAAGAQAALPRHGGRLEPLHAFYGPGAAEVFARGLDEGRSSVRENLGRMKTVFLDCPDPVEPDQAETGTPLGFFSNLNTAREARRAGFNLLGLAVREARPGGRAEPAGLIEGEVLDEIIFELSVNGETILSQAALPWRLDDLARGLMLTRGLIDCADDLDFLLVSADRRRVEAGLKPTSGQRPSEPPRAGSRPVWTPGELSAMFEEFEGRSGLWPSIGALNRGGLDRACFTFPGEVEEAMIFEDLTPLAALDRVLGHLLISRQAPGLGFILTSGRAGGEAVGRVLRGGAGGLIARLGPTATAVDLAREDGLFLAAPGPAGLMVYAD